MKILFVILLIYLCRNQIIWQSNTSVVINGAGQAVQNTDRYNRKIPQAPDAKWIWSKGYNQPTLLNPITIQQEFSVESNNPFTVYMTADNNFTLQIDGTQILRGDDFTKIYSKEFSLKCGEKHKFKITAYNTPGDCSPSDTAGVIYAFLQDSSNNKCEPFKPIDPPSPPQPPLLPPQPSISQSIVFQSNISAVISGAGQAVVNTHPYGIKIPQAPDAKWIWSNGWNGPTCLNPITIQQEFSVESNNPFTVYMTADNNFTLQIDGTQILRGDDFTKLYSKEFSLKCGEKHKFKITAYNTPGDCSSGNPAGLIYAFLQDSSNSKCPPKPIDPPKPPQPSISQSIVFQSNISAVISGAGQAVVNTHPYGIKIPQAPDAKWIWSNGWNGPTCLNPITIQQEFSVQSNNPFTVYMTADNNFTLQIDGTQILRGNNWHKIYSKEFSLKCGEKHKFKITAYNTGNCSPSNPAGLIYAFLQDSSNNKCEPFKPIDPPSPPQPPLLPPQPSISQSIVFQSNISAVISGAGQAVVNTHPYGIKIPQAPDAKWIWSNGWNGPTCLNPITIQQEFSVQSNNPFTVYMTADNNFTLQIDGTQILRGNNWHKIYSKEFSLKCGEKHKFKITAYNTGNCSPSNPAGLIYAFLQDSSNNKCEPFKPIDPPSPPQPPLLPPQPSISQSIVFQSNISAVISGAGQAVVNTHPYGIKIPQAPDAKWIWSNGWNGPTCLNPITIQQEFSVESNNPFTVYMTADNNFTLQIDGTQILRGDDFTKIYWKEFSLKCGQKHKFKITAYNTLGDCSPSNPAGLIYAFLQDSSNNKCEPFKPIDPPSPPQPPLLPPQPSISQSIVFQSNISAVISGAGQAVVNTHPYGIKIPQAPDAKWIWSNGWNGPTCLNPITIQQEFSVESNNPFTVYMTADNNFTLQIDGTQILRGDDFTKLYSKEFSLKCGEKHKFKITAYNTPDDCSSGNPAGLIYAFLQDSSNSKCPPKPIDPPKPPQPSISQSIVFQSNTSTVISGAGLAVVNTHPYGIKIPQAPDAKWIWSNGWNGPTCLNPITIQQEFSVESNNPFTVYMTADNNFTLQIDGTQILRGDDFTKLYSKEFSLKCGQKHKFKITAYNTLGDCSPSNPAGLIYAFLQDSSNNKCEPFKPIDPPKPPLPPQPSISQSIVFQSNTSTVISGAGLAVSTSDLYGIKIPQAPGATWIWSKECLNPTTIQQQFYVESKNPITVYMTADSHFTLYIDGNQILRGNNWQKIYSKEFSLKCGEKHKFKIVAQNAQGYCTSSYPAGLIYAFLQDGSSNKCPKHLPSKPTLFVIIHPKPKPIIPICQLCKSTISKQIAGKAIANTYAYHKQ